MAPTISTVGTESVPETIEHVQQPAATQSIPAIHLNDEPQEEQEAFSERASGRSEQQVNGNGQAYEHDDTEDQTNNEGLEESPSPEQSFAGLNTEIPTGDFDDPFASDEFSFSKRGSVLWGGKKANAVLELGRRQASKESATSAHRFSQVNLSPEMSRAQSRMSTDDRRMSQKVRSMYDAGDGNLENWSERPLSELSEHNSELGDNMGHDTVGELPRIGSPRLGYYADDSAPNLRSSSALSRGSSLIRKEPWEAAGGIEDWRDVEVGDVDRYGFIKAKNRHRSRGPSIGSTTDSDNLEMQRNHDSSSHSRRRPGAAPRPRKLQRPPPNAADRSSAANGGPRARPASRLRSNEEQTPSLVSSRSRLSMTPSTFSRSPNPNKGRRWANEAVTMLTSQPGRPETSAAARLNDQTSSSTPLERKREAKWEKMAKHPDPHPTTKSKKSHPVIGGGTSYTFDTSDPKLISRTWKGIPNRWRGTAWHSFLTASAKRYSGTAFVPDEALVDRFHALQLLDCPDDTQIDMDVPRTIGEHIMFRARYRGGQRLLFRVLRALALQFPATGYVQGMAPLAATLLCYYDEERAFVMGARMWECRGLRQLYSPGFSGLFACLDGFEKEWLSGMGAEVREKLLELGVASSAFGTKWYLTLFCYTLPYEAQLRVWDVFMLLGCAKEGALAGRGAGVRAGRKKGVAEAGLGGEEGAEEDGEDEDEDSAVPEGQFDVLHAVAAALVDALQPTLLDTDFEGVMRALTSHVPVGRPDVLMRVARREWAEKERRAQRHRQRQKARRR